MGACAHSTRLAQTIGRLFTFCRRTQVVEVMRVIILLAYVGAVKEALSSRENFVQSSTFTSEKTTAQGEGGTCPVKLTKVAGGVWMGPGLELWPLTSLPQALSRKSTSFLSGELRSLASFPKSPAAHISLWSTPQPC